LLKKSYFNNVASCKAHLDLALSGFDPKSYTYKYGAGSEILEE